MKDYTKEASKLLPEKYFRFGFSPKETKKVKRRYRCCIKIIVKLLKQIDELETWFEAYKEKNRGGEG